MVAPIMFDWDSATVKVTVPVHHTATVEMQEMELSLESFGRLLLTSVPSEWFAESPVSADLPLAIYPKDPA
jgi:hypothetical protein